MNAKQFMADGYHCSESILLAAGAHYLGRVDPLALRISTPFAGGVGGAHNELCGALSGGIILIGALYGRMDAQTNDDHCLALAASYREKFLQEFGNTRCQDLLDNWINKNGYENCRELVGRAAEILVSVLDKQERTA